MDGHLSILEGETASLPVCSLIDLFESHAHSLVTRNAPAVIDGTSDTSLNYAELDRSSTLIANKLFSFTCTVDGKAERVTDTQPVIAVYLSPSVTRVAVILAVWKINAILLPLDTCMPTARMRIILEESEASVVISSEDEPRFDELKAVCGEIGVLYLDYGLYLTSNEYCDTTRPPVFAESTTNPITAIYFTSGSTGVPKGVVMRTRNWLNLLTSYWKELPFKRGEVGCHKTPIGFVESLSEILVCLLNGVPIVVLGREVSSNPELLLRKVAEHKVSFLSLVPSMIRAIVKLHESDDNIKRCLSTLRTLLSTSETLEPETAKEMRTILPHNCRFANMYGSTEDTCNVTIQTLESSKDIDDMTVGGILSIGKPLLNTSVYILDDMRRRVEQGVQGNIYVSGANVSEGYLGYNEPGMFITMNNPKGYGGAETIYKTGDRGFVSGDRLYFTGRKDSLIKIRGQRISCAEVEQTVYQTDIIDKAVVLPVLSPDKKHTMKLVAFCSRKYVPKRDRRTAFIEGKGYFSISVDSIDSSILDDSNSLDDTAVESTVEAHCRLTLPSYMVPSVVVLKEFPLKPLSGKIDRDALIHSVSSNSIMSEEDELSPGSEEDILRIIANELQITKALLQKNMGYKFMELGGDSLSAVSAVVSLRARNFDVNIEQFIVAPISDVLRLQQSNFDHPPLSPNCLKHPEEDQTFKNRYIIKQLADVRDHESVKRLMALAFTQKNPLDVLMGTSLREFMVFLNSIWRPIVDDNMSFVVIDRQNRASIVAASLNVDSGTTLKPEVTMKEVTAINEAVEAPVKAKLAKTDGRWMDAMLNAVDVSLPNNITLPLLIMMEEFVIQLARNFDLDGIVTVNSHQVTMALAEQKFGYSIDNVLHVKSFLYEGRRPFSKADDNYAIKCMTKRLKI